MAKAVSLHASAIAETAQSVATSIAQAAKPGPAPVAAPGSPIDTAAAGVAGTVVKNVASSSAALAPRSAAGLAKSQAALTQLIAKDAEGASRIKTVPQGLQEPARGSGAGMQSAGYRGDDDWFYGDEDEIRPVPLDPPGAGPGPSVHPGSGVPSSLI